MAAERLTAAAARRIAIAAQGLAEPRPAGRVDRRHLRRAFDRVGVIQIDSVNVLARSHELVLFSRIGAHPCTLLADAADDGEIFEAWVHEASLVPSQHRYLYHWQMVLHSGRRWTELDRLEERRPGMVEQIFERVGSGGIVAGDVSMRVGPKAPWWDWDDGKLVLEHLFRTGRVTARRRRNDFARIYELPEHRLPAPALERPPLPEREARKALLALAARSYGVATLADLADYHRQKLTPCKPLVAELVDEGRLLPVTVDGWAQPAYLDPQARRPRKVAARALLSPFDPVVWFRPRAERMFGFHYRIEIYTPPPKRIYGYYVMPFLLGEHLVARVDLKADRQTGRLLVQSAFAEAGVPHEPVVPELAEELAAIAGWLDLATVVVLPRGDLAAPLARHLATTTHGAS